MKKYKIETIKDILEAVNPDNMDCFLKDFGAWLGLQMLIRATQEALGKESVVESISTDGSFNWIDDGKNDIKITVQVK